MDILDANAWLDMLSTPDLLVLAMDEQLQMVKERQRMDLNFMCVIAKAAQSLTPAELVRGKAYVNGMFDEDRR